MINLIREATFLIVFLRAADEADGYLLVGANYTGQRLSRQDSVSQFFADLRRRCERILLILIVLIEVAQALEEAKLERHWLGTVIHQECRVLAPLTHVESSEVERALLATAFVEDNGKLLLHAGSRYFDNLLLLLLTIDDDDQVFGDDVCRRGCHADLDPLNLVRMDLKLVGLDGDARLTADLLAERDVARHATLVLELDVLALLLIHRDELKVDHRFELDVRGGHQGMQVQLVWLSVALCQDLDHVMEVSSLGGFKLHAHLD